MPEDVTKQDACTFMDVYLDEKNLVSSESFAVVYRSHGDLGVAPCRDLQAAERFTKLVGGHIFRTHLTYELVTPEGS